MKKLLFSALLALNVGSLALAQSVAINTDGAASNASAILDVKSTTHGVLIPRMTLAQRNLITVNASTLGLLIFQTDNTPGFYFYNGTAWTQLGGTSGTTSSVYGDGSGGALNITTNTDWTSSPPASFNFQYSSISVASGVTFIVPSGTKLRSSGTVTINGTINVVGTDVARGVTSVTGSIARHGPNLGNNVAIGALAGTIASLIDIPPYAGSQGMVNGVGDQNQGGAGGGSFAIYANGGNASSGNSTLPANINGSGGGGGGLVVLLSKVSVANAGTVSARGGNGSEGVTSTSTRPGGGGGGGGIIVLASPTNTAGTLNVNGGSGGAAGAASANTTAQGGTGGACGGSGGAGGIAASSQPSASAAGSVGITRLITVASPENLY
jgi:hypothetical protein